MDINKVDQLLILKGLLKEIRSGSLTDNKVPVCHPIEEKLCLAIRYLEEVYGGIITHTDIKTNSINPEVFKNLTQAEITEKLQRLNDLSVLIDHEARTFFSQE